MVGIVNNETKLVRKRRLGIFERNPVPATVGRILLWVPFESQILHGSIVATLWLQGNFALGDRSSQEKVGDVPRVQAGAVVVDARASTTRFQAPDNGLHPVSGNETRERFREVPQSGKSIEPFKCTG